MAFGVATVVSYVGKAMMADRLAEAATYTAAPAYVGLGVGAEEGGGHTAEASATKLVNEAKEANAPRVKGAFTFAEGGGHGVNNIMVLKGKQTAGTTEIKVNEAGVFDKTGENKGNMAFYATLNVDALAIGDSIEWTWKVEFS